MPWCPNCKTEYQEGYTTCSDCSSDLVESLEQAEVFVPIFHTSDEKLGEKLVRFFEYSDLSSQMNYDDATEIYTVSIPGSEEKEARKLYEAFYFVETNRIQNERNNNNLPKEQEEGATEEEDDIYHNMDPLTLDDDNEDGLEEEATNEDVTEYKPQTQTTAYVMKAEQYKELNSTVWVFTLFGIAGLIFVLLNIVGILDLFGNLIPYIVMTVLFLAFLYVGLSTHRKAKVIHAQIYEEEKMTSNINDWLTENITEDFLSTIHDSSLSDELNHIKKMDIIKDMIIKEFKAPNLAYVDRLIDEFYNNIEHVE